MKADFRVLLVAALSLGAVPVAAQVGPGAPGSDQAIPEKDRSRPADMPKAEAPDASPHEDGLPTGRSLSERLDKSHGVIKPPEGVDPGIEKPAPAPGADHMPVVPPPSPPEAEPK